jgi:hypothetical protein
MSFCVNSKDFRAYLEVREMRGVYTHAEGLDGT